MKLLALYGMAKLDLFTLVDPFLYIILLNFTSGITSRVSIPLYIIILFFVFVISLTRSIRLLLRYPCKSVANILVLGTRTAAVFDLVFTINPF